MRWLRVTVLCIAIWLLFPVGILAGDPVQSVTVVASGWVPGAPGGLTLTYVSDFEIGISWTKDPNATTTMIRMKYGSAPEGVDDGYMVYNGTAESCSDTNIDLSGLTLPPYYAAFSQNAEGSWGEPVSEEGNFMSTSWLFMALLVAAVGLTCTMFITKQRMLGFAAAIFWAFFGAHSYTLSSAAWDLYFNIAFGSILGMITFTIFAQYGLRERKGARAEEELKEPELGEEEPLDEWAKDEKELDEITSARSKAIRGRALRRRTRRW